MIWSNSTGCGGNEVNSFSSRVVSPLEWWVIAITGTARVAEGTDTSSWNGSGTVGVVLVVDVASAVTEA